MTPFVCYETWEWQPVFRSAEQSRMPNYRPIKNHCGIFGKSESQVSLILRDSYFLFVPTHSQFVIAVVYWYFWSPFKCPFKLCFGFVTEVRLWTSHLINKKPTMQRDTKVTAVYVFGICCKFVADRRTNKPIGQNTMMSNGAIVNKTINKKPAWILIITDSFMNIFDPDLNKTIHTIYPCSQCGLLGKLKLSQIGGLF